MIAPESSADPLVYTPEVDPAMRQFLGFGSPLVEESIPAEAAPPAEAAAAPAATAIPTETAPASGATAPPEPAPPAEPALPLEPTPAPPPQATPTTTGWDLFRWLLPGEARAAAPIDRASDWKGWVAEREQNVAAYLKRVGLLLASVSTRVIQKEKRPAGDADLFRKLLLATAWQESCWRQFVVKNDKVTYLRSTRASVGMMQVNERVWRGFYEVDKLRWKVAYNADAGAEVLLHYLDLARDSARDAKTTPAPADFARAVYAGYNGGPGQIDRYVDPKTRGKALSRVIDKLFAPKFAAAGDGVEKQVAACLVGESDAAG